MLGERTRNLNHTNKLKRKKKRSKNRLKIDKDEDKVIHFISNNQQLTFRMGNSRLSGTSMEELGNHELKSVCNTLSLPRKAIILGCTKKCAKT